MCEDLNMLRVVYYIKNVFDIFLLIIPILLILMSAIDLGKIVIGTDDAEKKTISAITKRGIAAVVVFFIPTIVTLIMNMIEVDGSKNGLICWSAATAENIGKLQSQKEIDDEINRLRTEEETNNDNSDNDSSNNSDVSEEDNSSDNSNDENGDDEDDGPFVIPTSSSFKPFVNGEQRALVAGDCMKKEDNCACPTVGNMEGFRFTVADEKSRNFSWVERSYDMVRVTVKCSNGFKMSESVNSNYKDKVEAVFNKICQLTTTGINGIKINSNQLLVHSGYVGRLNSARSVCSYHAYGAAIDINYDLNIKIGGETYKPYSSMGTKTKEEYDRFVAALGGNESDNRNVNYILWKYAFEPSGFTWGGNWSVKSFDPMHYQVK